jgi:hypothetical protein
MIHRHFVARPSVLGARRLADITELRDRREQLL